MGSCLHARRAFYRIRWRNGSGAHVAEMCPDCRQNVRGSGCWVAGDKCPVDPADLPFWSDVTAFQTFLTCSLPKGDR
jgi:hypothetical protein